MAINIPTNSTNQTISDLRSNGLLNSTNQIFFGVGNLAGTINDTQIKYNPLKSLTLNAQDFSDLNPSQLASVQQAQNLQIDQLNSQKLAQINQYNQLRQGRVQQAEDTLATTQMLFPVVGGLQPLQSSRNAGALTGLQAGARNDLTNLFSQGQQAINQLDQTGSMLGLTALNNAIAANQQQNQINFGQASTLTQQLGTFVDQKGNLQNIAGQTNVRTLAGIGSDMNQVQLQDSLESSALGRLLNKAQNERANTTLQDSLQNSDLQRQLSTAQNERANNAENRTNELFPIEVNNQLLQQNQLIKNIKLAEQQIVAQQAFEQQAGFLTKIDSTSGKASVDIAKLGTYGISISDVLKTNQALLQQGGTSSLKPALDAILDTYSSTGGNQITKKIWFENPTDKKNSFVAYQINKDGKPAGYRTYNVPDPQAKVKYKVDGVEVENTIAFFLGNNGLKTNTATSDQDINNFLSQVTNEGKAKVLNSQEFVQNLAKSTSDEDIKKFVIRGMLGQQLNSSFTDLQASDPNAGQRLAQDFISTLSGGNQYDATKDILNADGNTQQIQKSKFNFTDSNLSKDDKAYAEVLKEMLSLKNELKNNFGDEGKAKEYFSWIVGAFLGTPDNPQVKLAENIYSIKLNP